MYLRELVIKNSGPIRALHLEFAFDGDNRPIPHVIVGKNGAGKTNLLSLIADALMEGAADVYNDVLKRQALGRNWFRVVGGRTVTYNESSSYSILRFDHAGQALFYHENSGNLLPSQAKEMVPASLADGANWSDDGKHGKNFEIAEDTVRDIYPRGAYAFFPSTRSEIPHWLNQASIQLDEYDTSDNYSQFLGKPMFIEHGINDFAQWLLGVLTESRAEIGQMPNPDKRGEIGYGLVDAKVYENGQAALRSANSILRIIMDNPQARFYWAGRRQPRKVGVAIGNQSIASGLDSLSGGQSSMLAVFGAILRHGDAAGIPPSDLEGVVVIDELDAHIHIDLQLKALPELIKFFPKVQFISSSHSPFFTLGMEKNFGDAGLRIIELPSGLTLTAEAYSEFENALSAMRSTRAFENEVEELIKAGESPVILLGGKTDVGYFHAAAHQLGYGDLADLFESVGKSGTAGDKNSGDGNLTNAIHLLQANPDLTGRKIIAVYDCDAKKVAASDERVHVIKLEQIPDRKMKKGIENMIPDDAFTPAMYDDKPVEGDYGDAFTKPVFNKARACDLLSGESALQAHFEDFRPILEQIRAALFPPGGQRDPSPPDSSGE